MSGDTVFQTCGEMGFPYTPEGKDDWQFVGGFTPGLRDRADLTAMTRKLTNDFGEESFFAVVVENEEGLVSKVYLLIPPDSAISVAVWEMVSAIENGQPVCDKTFWEYVDPVIQKRWDTMHPFERIDIARDADALGAVLDEKVPTFVHTLIYQDLEL